MNEFFLCKINTINGEKKKSFPEKSLLSLHIHSSIYLKHTLSHLYQARLCAEPRLDFTSAESMTLILVSKG